MWPVLRLRALTSLRSFRAPSQTLGSQLPAWTINFPQSDAAQSQWQQWQQTRGMAVPKRKVGQHILSCVEGGLYGMLLYLVSPDGSLCCRPPLAEEGTEMQ